MDNIIYHQNHSTTSTYNTKVAAGTVNPFDIRTYKQVININSRFRNNYTTTPASDYYFTMSDPIKKAISMKLLCINLPKIIYTVNKNTGSNNFTVHQEGLTNIIDIASGSYTGPQIATAITKKFAAQGYDISLNYNLITGKMTFLSVSDKIFDIRFDYIDPSKCGGSEIYSQVGSNLYKDQLTLGWLLGFRKNYQFRTPINATTQNGTTNSHNYNSRKEVRKLLNLDNKPNRITQVKADGFQYLERNFNCCATVGIMMYPDPLDICYTYTCKTSYESEAIYDAHGTKYFLLSVNDFQNNHTTAVVSPLQEETLGNGCIIAKVSSVCGCNESGNEHIDRIYFGPTEISRLHIKLLDEFGRILDLNNGDYSLTLEFEILYDL